MRWSYDIHQDGNQTSFHGNPLVTNQLVLIGTDKGCAAATIGHIYAFDRETGAIRWKYRTVGTPTDIARIGSTAYSISFSDELIALNLSDGSLIWKTTTAMPNPDCILPPSPVVAGDRVFYVSLDGTLYSLDGQTGKVLWKRDLGAHPTTKLGLLGNSLYIGTVGGRLLRISTNQGRLESELPVPGVPSGRILIKGDSALYAFLQDRDSQGGYLIGTDVNLSHINWTQKTAHSWASEWPRLWNGFLLAGNCRGELTAFRPSDGAPQWSDKLRGCLRSIGLDGNGQQIYIGTQEGVVYSYSPPVVKARTTKPE